MNIEEYEKNGFAVVENFLSSETCDLLKQECDRIIESNKFLENLAQIPSFESKDENAEVSSNLMN